jgi:2-oxo-4-hydroxy-4-carboxy-5-ureidoimidazoline decarboxylase
MSDTAFLDRASGDDATALLRRCCGSTHWVREMVDARPFGDSDTLRAQAERVADHLTRDDWLEAFSQHPRIGDREVLRARYASAGGWEGGEQSGVVDAGDDVLDALADANREYERRFGFIFLVCATGKSAADMLALLRERIENDPADEWRVAAAEQRKITQLRIDKLVAEHAPT